MQKCRKKNMNVENEFLFEIFNGNSIMTKENELYHWEMILIEIFFSLLFRLSLVWSLRWISVRFIKTMWCLQEYHEKDNILLSLSFYMVSIDIWLKKLVILFLSFLIRIKWLTVFYHSFLANGTLMCKMMTKVFSSTTDIIIVLARTSTTV